jgi:DNA-3-methyladenine glycosylase
VRFARKLDGAVISGRIIETEAYLSETDPASHAYNGLSSRNASLFKSGGHLYIHSMHGHHCMDIVTESQGSPTSVLIRALEPLQGIEVMKQHRSQTRLESLCSGPGKLTQALAIDKCFDGIDTTNPTSPVQLYYDGYEPKQITQTTRIGISKATQLPYRFHS